MILRFLVEVPPCRAVCICVSDLANPSSSRVVSGACSEVSGLLNEVTTADRNGHTPRIGAWNRASRISQALLIGKEDNLSCYLLSLCYWREFEGHRITLVTPKQGSQNKGSRA